MKTLVIGLGNPILGDDSVGWRIAEQVRLQIEKLSLPVEVDYLSLGGLSLMERLVGYENVIIIDAIYSGQKPVGSVDSFSLDELHNPNDGHTASAHDTTLMTALNAGRRLSLSLPEKVQVVAVEVKNVHDFSEELSAPVAASVPLAVDRVMELLGTLHSCKV